MCAPNLNSRRDKIRIVSGDYSQRLAGAVKLVDELIAAHGDYLPQYH